MNIYLLLVDEYQGYDTYDEAVIIAESEEAALAIWLPENTRYDKAGEWTATKIGKAEKGSEPGEVCASFNAV